MLARSAARPYAGAMSSLRSLFPRRLPILLGGAAIVLAPLPAGATKRLSPAALSPAAEYVQARAADADGQSRIAAVGYAAVLAASPDDIAVARRAYLQAMIAGDERLALGAARALERGQALTPDAQLLLMTDAVSAGDWKRASAAVDAIAKNGAFDFAVPVLRAWIALGSGAGDPLALLDGDGKAGPIARAYASEHRALLLLATGRIEEGVSAVRALASSTGGPSPGLRLAAAAALARTDKARAMDLLAGDAPLLADARARLAAGKPLASPVDSPAAGIAELFTRIAIDVQREQATPLSLVLARMATFLAPRSGEAWLVTSGLLGSAGNYDEALAALDQIRRGDPFAQAAAEARIGLLLRRGDKEEALKHALAAANRRDARMGDWARVGGVYADLKRPAEAAKAYTRALQLTKADDPSRGTLLLLQGSALDQAGDWPAAKAALEEAVKIGPDQAVALNYLGYAQLERGENLAAAEKLVEEASRLKPENAAITDSLGWTYYLRGDIPKAIATLERAVAGDPGEPTINEHLGDAYWRAGRRVEARWAWRAAMVYADPEQTAKIRAKLDGSDPLGTPAH